MGLFDVLLMAVILGGASWLLYRSLWKKKGCCSSSECNGCSSHKEL